VRSVIVNTVASIDHECRIGAGVHVGLGVRLAGCIEIGERAFIGTGAVVLPRRKIGDMRRSAPAPWWFATCRRERS